MTMFNEIGAVPSVASAARANLERIVETGKARTGSVIERVMSETPEDYVVLGRRIGFSVPDTGNVIATFADHAGNAVDVIAHDNAFGQIVDRTAIPRAYAKSLAVADGRDQRGNITEGNEWRRELLAHSLREHFTHGNGHRYLMRTRGDQLRGFLSDRYRRLDSRPLLDAFVGACNDVGAIPVEGVANDVRCSVRAILPRVVEPVPGEAMVFGLSWTNSDYGCGTYAISAFVLRLVCLNGMVGQNDLRQVHLGGRLPDDLVFSAETYRKDTETMALATRDMVRGLLNPSVVERKADAVRAAHETEVSFERAFGRVKNALTKDEGRRVKESFEGPDTVMLPPGRTEWRFSNALSWVANQTEENGRKLELQELAGKTL